MTQYLVNLLEVGGGLILLISLAVLVGRADATSRDQAWKRIAVARRLQHEREQALLDRVTACPCRRCPLKHDAPDLFED